MITEDWNDSANSEVKMHETTCKAKLTNRIANMIMILHTMSVISYAARIILADVDITVSQPIYIHKMELPFDVNTQQVYRMVLYTQFATCITGSWAVAAVNALLLTLVNCKCRNAIIEYKRMHKAINKGRGNYSKHVCNIKIKKKNKFYIRVTLYLLFTVKYCNDLIESRNVLIFRHYT